MDYSSKSNILNNIMTLLKGLPIYKDFQSDATLVPKPGCRSESLGEFFVSSCPEWLLKYRFSKKKKNRFSVITYPLKTKTKKHFRKWSWEICIFKEPLSDKTAL